MNRIVFLMKLKVQRGKERVAVAMTMIIARAAASRAPVAEVVLLALPAQPALLLLPLLPLLPSLSSASAAAHDLESSQPIPSLR